MRQRIHKILVTGGAGFIGSAFVRLLLKKDCPPKPYQLLTEFDGEGGLSLKNKKGLSPQEAIWEDTKGAVPKLIVVDKLTYAGDLERLKEVNGKYKFYKADICDKKSIESIFKEEKPQTVVNFAASTHVDRSIINATPFIETNVKGIQVLLDVSKKYKIKRFLQVSSDEVYGDILKGRFTEESPLKPNSPYAASKAAADLVIRSYIRTYDFPAIIVRPCNNYGPWQYPEKLISLAILKILRNKRIPVYGDGKNVREWLYVEDGAEGILQILEKGKIGEIYNLGFRDERKNINVVKMILKILKKDEEMVEFVKDRPGHDLRYSLDPTKIFQEIGWSPKLNFEEGLIATIHWCLKYKNWLFNKQKDTPPLDKY